MMRRDRVLQRVLAERGREVSLERVHSAYSRIESRWLLSYGNRAISPEETNEAYRQKDNQVLRDLFPEVSHEEAEGLSKAAREGWVRLERDLPPELYPDAEPLLRRLRTDGYRLALVSNAPSDTLAIIDALGLRRFMGSVVVSGVVGFSKPHPEIFRTALRETGTEAGETVHVGDVYESDIVGARSAGIEGILIDRDGGQPRPDCPSITSLDEVYRYLS